MVLLPKTKNYKRLAAGTENCFKKKKEENPTEATVEVSNENDNSYNIFNMFFGFLNVSFTDYRDNHITDGKNKVKIQKWLYNQLSTNCENFFRFFSKFIHSDLYNGNFYKIVIGDKLYCETGEHKNPITNIDFEKIIKINYSKDTSDKVCFKFRKKGTDNIVINLLCNKERFYDYINLETLREAIKKIYERIGTERAPTRKLFFVVSLNFADWFLASTAETWGSCLNLDSTYEECFWKGLPALIEDKNRCMVYLTDGTLKDYHGIKTYKIISRSWGLLERKIGTTDIFLEMVRSYPNNFLFDKLFKENFSELAIGRANFSERSLYECPYNFDGMFIVINKENSYAASIYCDSCALAYDYTKKKFFWYLCDRGPSRLYKENGEINSSDEGWYVEYTDGLSTMIECNDEIENHWC